MNIQTRQIAAGISLSTIPLTQYKTNLISIYFRRPLNREEVTRNSLIPYVLRAGSVKHDTVSKMTNALQNLYGSSIGVGVSKVGEEQILSFKLVMTDERYLDEAVTKPATDILLDMIFCPVLEQGAFRASYISVEKEVLEESIRAKINDKGYYAFERMVAAMCADEPYSIPEEGFLEDLADIDAQKLYAQYQNLIETSEIDIVLAGDLDADEFQTQFLERLPRRAEGQFFHVLPTSGYPVQERKELFEAMNVVQGKLSMGFRVDERIPKDRDIALILYSAILGSGVSSKLFRNVREKHSLCYSIGASLEMQKSLMFINAGVEPADYEFAKEKILAEVEAMRRGEITEEELLYAKKQVTHNVRSINDALMRISDYLYTQKLQGRDRTTEEIIDAIARVPREEIIAVAQGVDLDTIFFLTNEGAGDAQ